MVEGVSCGVEFSKLETLQAIQHSEVDSCNGYPWVNSVKCLLTSIANGVDNDRRWGFERVIKYICSLCPGMISWNTVVREK